MPASATRPPAVARVLERATATSRRHGLFHPGDLVLVACSGGPDSIALLHVLHRLRRLFRIRLAVFHFDHRLRPGSDRDAAYVRRQAEALGLVFHLRAADDAPPAGSSVEAWARLARYAALTSVASEIGATRGALGHTLDDQAETVLIGLVRGGGIDAVAGMPPAASLPPLGFPASRPLLDTTRGETEAFCRSLRLRPRRDPTNDDPRFLRNRIRHQVLPVLEERVGREVRETIARTAGNVRADADYLDGLASAAARDVVSVRDDELRLDVEVLRALPEPVAARVARESVRLAAAMAGGWEAHPGAAHIRAIVELARGRAGRRVELPGDLVAERRKGYVRLSHPSPESDRSGRSDGDEGRRAQRRASERTTGGR